MASRLDRLFTLLDTGSSNVRRRAAASQLGEVQSLHPHELHNLLKSILTYLKSPSWDTRIAAGWAVEAVLKKVPEWCPIGMMDEESNEAVNINSGRLSCDTFNLDKVIAESAYLMGSEGKEYEVVEDAGDCQENLARQKEMMNKQLGLDRSAQFGLDTSTLFTDEDLKIEFNTKSKQKSKLNVGEVVGMSCREANRAKRKARQAVLKQKTQKSTSQDKEKDEDGEPQTKKIKTESTTPLEENTFCLPVPDNIYSWPADVNDWPLDWFCDQLTLSLFSPTWEERHGAGTALKHLMKTQGMCGGKTADIPQSQMEEHHQSWLEDIALRLIIVLSLDRFGDYINDQVVAPVRETCAQALGSVIFLMEKDRIKKILSVLIKFLNQKDWETRHGGLLGIKYMFAVRQDLLADLLPQAFDSLYSALKDANDDVTAVAGGALSIAVDIMATSYPEYALSVLESLCLIIPEQDDLTPAANTLVPLLAQLLLKPNINCLIKSENTVIELVQRLWSLLEHNNAGVRKAALQAFCCLPSQPSFSSWPNFLQPTLRHVYQRALIEHQTNVHNTVESVWSVILEKSQLSDILIAACPFISIWLCLAMQSTKIPFDQNLLIQAKSLMKEHTAKHLKSITGVDCTSRTNLKQYIGGTESLPQSVREENSTHTRYVAAKMLGKLSTYIVQPAPGIDYMDNVESPIDCYIKVLLVHLESKSSLQRFVAGLVITEWAKCNPPSPPPKKLVEKLIECLNETFYYDEIGLSYSRLLQDTKDFLALLKHYKLPQVDEFLNINVLLLDKMEEIIGKKVQTLLQDSKLKPKVLEELLERRQVIHTSITSILAQQTSLHVMTQASLASACLWLGQLPDKLTVIVKPLMESIKKEENEQLQILSAKHLASLMQKSVSRRPCPNAKIVGNLCIFISVDPEFTPKVSMFPEDDPRYIESTERIITLTNQHKFAERAVILKKNNSTLGRGRPSLHDVQFEEIVVQEEQYLRPFRIQRRGCKKALEQITEQFGEDLPEQLPNLWETITQVKNVDITLPPSKSFDIKDETALDKFIGNLHILEVTCPLVHLSLRPKIIELLPKLVHLLSHNYKTVRHMAARCIGTFAQFSPVEVITAIVDKVLPMVNLNNKTVVRQGAVEMFAVLLEKLDLQITPYIVFLIIPVLGQMSDFNPSIRTLATHTFADLIQLMPLDGAVSTVKLPPELVELKEKRKSFIEQLMNPTKITDYKVPVQLNVQLRSYQQAGVNWLAFLNKYRLHGLLCDDMGLGKTLQSICILVGDHYHRKKRYQETRKEGGDYWIPLPSLVICPPTLTGHWVYEIKKFVPKQYMQPFYYGGPSLERKKLANMIRSDHIVVSSYDVVRKDISSLNVMRWNYLILDEGHVIKNGKSKLTVALKQIIANHRLILSGTPIQSNVLELWSLFDFLMPGFLGTEKQFIARYSKPILASRDPKCSTKEQEAGVIAMEALHRQVLPFVLRRTKEDVLKDLPPKITQDYYCDLSPVQQQLYDFYNTTTYSLDKSAHIFQALRYLQRVCNHPKLALTPTHPQYGNIMETLNNQKSTLADIKHACKFPALKQLLIECGIGAQQEQNDNIVNQHRALIFCQLKAMLDIVENDFLKIHMPKVTYLRLDGSVPVNLRHSLTTRFNNDPSIDLLILTTHVGGIGLNLTGADTVIFIEHDWSPMKDIQAMDRAHRIGQNKVVNVYRLITRDTIEEKIMGLQKFKLKTANTIISSENASLQTMSTDKLLDLFTRNDENQSSSSKSDNQNKPIFSELWDKMCSDYDEEYDLSNFISSLQS
ncbi:TATA-binding protein-associated factor 172 [Cimex lectularius]|uniref:TATA-binding protein-associated factor 172 n=1 Tax=Cimex lectularius TaxID=79782 RepID=A0A8I6RCL9_CIMLE|nr:TATA-binding protein-associated factor 172 [Cimex lectularius]